MEIIPDSMCSVSSGRGRPYPLHKPLSLLARSNASHYAKTPDPVPLSIQINSSCRWPATFPVSLALDMPNACQILQILLPHYVTNKYQLSHSDCKYSFYFHFSFFIVYTLRPWYSQHPVLGPHFCSLQYFFICKKTVQH